MKRLIPCLICSVLAASLLAADRPAKATINMLDGSQFAEAYVIKEGLEHVEWARDSKASATTRTPAAEVASVDYANSRSERDFLKGEGAFNSNNWDAAVDGYSAAFENARSGSFRVRAGLKKSEALAKLKRWDDAVKAADAVIGKYGDWRYVIDAYELKSGFQAKAGKADAAIATWRELGKKSKQLGAYSKLAVALAASGEAAALRSKGDDAGAAKLLKSALANLKPETAPAQYGKIAIAYGNALIATGDEDDAFKLYTGMRYAPIEGSYRAAAFLGAGMILKGRGETLAAVDHLITAVVLRGGSGTTRSMAKKEVAPMLKALGKDESLDPQIQKEYRAYAANL